MEIWNNRREIIRHNMNNKNYILITPVKDEEKTISFIIDSVLNQTLKPKLWIIVNDNSKDNSLKIIKEKIKSIEWIKVITKEINKEYNWFGYGNVIKEGINYCLENNIFLKYKTDYVGILDGDITIDNNYFEELVSIFINNKDIGVGSGIRFIKKENNWQKEEEIKRPISTARLYRLESLKKTDFFIHPICPDMILNIKIEKKGYLLIFLENISCFHYRGVLEKDNSKIKSLFLFGKSRYILGCNFRYILINYIYKGLKEKIFLLQGLILFLGYFYSFLMREKKIKDKDILEYFKKEADEFFFKAFKVIKIIIKKYFNPFCHIIIKTNKDYKKTILLIGSPRSGTTFLSEIINYDNSFRYLFEPFNKEFERFFKKFDLYFNKNNKDQDKYNAVKKILSGNINSWWINKYNKKLIDNKRLIKDINIHFISGYIKNNFPEIPLVIILRNPFSVIDSQIYSKMGELFLDSIIKEEQLINDYFKGYKSFILKINSKGSVYEKRILQWCLHNYVLLKEIGNKSFITFYENYLTNPEEETKKVFSYLNIKYDNKISSVLKRPSKTSRDKNLTKGNLLNKWNKRISIKEQNKCKYIISLFGLDKIYKEGEKPSVEGVRDFINNFELIN